MIKGKCKKRVAEVIDKYLIAFDGSELDGVDYKYVNQANQAIKRILNDFMKASDYYGTPAERAELGFREI